MSTIFVANRGEIATRIGRTVKQLGHKFAIAYPPVDASMPYVTEADVAIEIESPRSFSDVGVMVAAAQQAGADFVHPGYGFLSENSDFARTVRAEGMKFVGPSASAIEQMGDKARARELAISCGVPVTPGSPGPVETLEEVLNCAETLGYPLMIKAVAGGGGIGMAVVYFEEDLQSSFTQVSGRAVAVFSDARLIVERYIARSRHIETQVMGLPNGEVIAFAERDCSVQRRHQKVIEESPSPALNEKMRAAVAAEAVAMATKVGYENAGTVEFIYDLDRGEFYFLEMNTRLQVEHPITEAVHNVDLVAWQLSVAQGSSDLPRGFSREPQGHAVELRLYAEDSEKFLPRPGVISTWDMPSGEGVRVDAGYDEGCAVTPYFDPLMAKLIVHGATRNQAVTRTINALTATTIEGPGANIAFLHRVLESSAFQKGDYTTGLVVDHG